MKIKKILSILLLIAIAITVLPTSVFAKGSYTAYANAKTIYVGKTTNIIIKGTNAAGKFTLSSSDTSVATVSKSKIWVDGSKMDGTITVKGIKAGTATITVTPADVSDDEYNLLTNVVNIKITVKETKSNVVEQDNKQTVTTTKSSDATLKSMTLENGKINFDKNTTKYTVNVDKDVTTLGLKAVPTSSKATVKITGDSNLEVGINIVKVTVTAEDGTTKVYEVTVIKSAYGHSPLLDLKVKGYNLTPEFDTRKTVYSVDVIGETKLELEYKLANEASKVEITGNENLKLGRSTIDLKVTEPDGIVTVYRINVNNAEILGQNNLIWIIIIIVLSILVIIEGIIIILKKKKDDDE